MTLELGDLIERFSRTVDDYKSAQHDTLIQAWALECLVEIGVVLTHESVNHEHHLLMPGGILVLPALCLQVLKVTDCHGQAYTSTRINSKTRQIHGCPCEVWLYYERIQANDNQEIEYDALCEPALTAWLSWRWQELRPQKDQSGELRKANLNVVIDMRNQAYMWVGNVRGKMELNKLRDPANMAAVHHVRSHQDYTNPRR